MDDLHLNALAWSPLSNKAPALETEQPSTAPLTEQQALQHQGDHALIEQLVHTLDQQSLAAMQPVAVPVFSQVGQWAELFCKTINQADFLDWADARQLDFTRMQVRAGRLIAPPHTFRLADDSGWWKHATPLIAIAQLVDPTDQGMPYLGDRITNTERSLPLERVLAFYGYPMPANRLQAQAIIDELQALNAFPGFDGVGQSKSLIHAERVFQQQDFLRLADALENTATAKVQLDTDSMLARLYRQAQELLQAIVDDNDLSPLANVPLQHHFDATQGVLRVTAQGDGAQTRELVPAAPDERWDRLAQICEKIGIDIYPDTGIPLLNVLQAYGIDHPVRRAERDQLILRLRRAPLAPLSLGLKSERTLVELDAWRQYIGLLNDCHAMRTALQGTIDKGSLEQLDTMISADPDTLLRRVQPAYAQLRELTDDPAFVAIRTRAGADPASHVLLSATGSIGAYGRDGIWMSLTEAVTDNHLLAVKVAQLAKIAKHTGGQLRSNSDVSLVQALRLYQIDVPATLEEARQTLQRLAVSQPLRNHQKHYWRALKPLQRTHPPGWTLSHLERQWVCEIIETFMQGRDEPLFEYLSRPLLAGKKVEDVRAEADLLLTRLLAHPQTQQLGIHLANRVQWHGSHASETSSRSSRDALILSALILDLDPQFATHPQRIKHIDWCTPYYWGESVSLIRSHIERSLTGLGECNAALAAHLLLSDKAPYLLVRGVLDSTPGLAAQSWVLLRQYVTHLEAGMPGTSRQLSHDEIMQVASLPPKGTWKAFLDSPDAALPVLDWAVANGVLVQKPRYDIAAANIALQALNSQRKCLGDAAQAFAEPVVTLRQTLLAEPAPVTDTFNADIAGLFEQQLVRLQSAYVESIQYWLSQLTLREREALEYGDVTFFAVTLKGRIARFGVLIQARFYSDRYCFECFPKHLLIRRRRDLDTQDLPGTSAPHLDWQAHAEGVAPGPLEQANTTWAVTVQKLNPVLPAPDTLPPLDDNGLRVPRSFDSPRCRALATLVVEHHLLYDAHALKEKLKPPLTRQSALEADDAWAAYLTRLKP
ncbi:MAG: hypothetical protein GAK37_00627 [Pseudomonas sp.]|nr:MAG: hypothetical protein GAK37_00627 [Pseudomonas sp.]